VVGQIDKFDMYLQAHEYEAGTASVSWLVGFWSRAY
jgi:hypothetical protein